MNGVKKFILAVSVGGLLGAVLFAWLSPYLIVWYFSPPAELSLSCSPAVDWGIKTYQKVMLTGTVLGAIFAGVLFFAFGKKSPPARPSAPSAPTAS